MGLQFWPNNDAVKRMHPFCALVNMQWPRTTGTTRACYAQKPAAVG